MLRMLRVRRGVLQTPVIRYRQRSTGRTVTLVGTAHIGEASYYKTLHAMVTQMEAAGAVVLYEAVRPAAESDWAAASASERAARGAPQAMGQDSSRRVCRSLRWVEQRAVFACAPSWRNADMTDLELVRQARPEALVGLGEDLADVFRTSLGESESDAFAGAAAGISFRLLSLDWFDRLRRVATWDAASRHFDDVKVAERNARALARLPPGEDAVLLWGAGHLPGLAAGLKETGHRRQATSWVNVGKLPALWASIRTVVKYFPARG
jgi:hypothetical protein